MNTDYHVEYDRHYYSAFYVLTGEAAELRVTAATVEVFHRCNRVASDVRSSTAYQVTKVDSHWPKAHQRHLEWTRRG